MIASHRATCRYAAISAALFTLATDPIIGVLVIAALLILLLCA